MVATPVVVQAAGRGRRMGHHVEKTNKLLLEVDGIPLIIRNLEMLATACVQEVAVVVSSQSAELVSTINDSQVARHFRKLHVVVDPDPRQTLSSTRCAHDAIGDREFVCLEGSTLFHPAALYALLTEDLVADEAVISLTYRMHVAPTHSWTFVDSDRVVEFQIFDQPIPPLPSSAVRLGRFTGAVKFPALIWTEPSGLDYVDDGIEHLLRTVATGSVRALWDDGGFRHFAYPCDFGLDD